MTEHLYDEMPGSLVQPNAPITILRTDTYNTLKTQRDVYHALLREVVQFIDAYQSEQADYSSIELEESAATLRGKIMRALLAELGGEGVA